MVEENEYDSWNTIKKAIQSGGSVVLRFPQEKEVWMSFLGKNIGFEQNGGGKHFSRPLLIIKKFNNQMFWCVPLSTAQKNFDFYLNFIDPDGKKVSVILAQIKLTSVKRLKRRMYRIENTHFELIRHKLASYLT